MAHPIAATSQSSRKTRTEEPGASWTAASGGDEIIVASGGTTSTRLTALPKIITSLDLQKVKFIKIDNILSGTVAFFIFISPGEYYKKFFCLSGKFYRAADSHRFYDNFNLIFLKLKSCVSRQKNNKLC